MQGKKLAIFGIDGADPKRVGKMLKAGMLPNLAQLADEGCFGRLATTHVSQSPVAWSSFMTGMNPGKHGVFDFIMRDPKTLGLKLGLNDEITDALGARKFLPVIRERPFWNALGEAGVRGIAAFIPVTFPPVPFNGIVLGGMGVPDLRGTQGMPAAFTNDPKFPKKQEVVFVKGGDAELIADESERVKMKISVSAEYVEISIAGEKIRLRSGEWSKYVRAMFGKREGVMRFRLLSLRGEKFVLYASPVMISPYNPHVNITEPAGIAKEIADAAGVYKNNSFESDVHGLKEGLIDEAVYREDMYFTLETRAKAAEYLLRNKPWEFFTCNFFAVDRAQHMFMRFEDGGHPYFEENPEFAGEIEKAYVRMDSEFGKFRKIFGENCMTFVISDHGFSTYRWNVQLNKALMDAGLLGLREGETSETIGGINWARTKAYAAGFAGVYINLKGREAKGIVDARESEGVMRDAASVLGKIRHRGVSALEGTLRGSEIFFGPYAKDMADIVPLYNEGFRASRETALGGVGAGGTVYENRSKWCADHIGPGTPERNAGVIFCGEPLELEGANIMCLAPTALKYFGAKNNPNMDGRSMIK
ncbi:MAG: alkaline phosphatase family protein [Candidatus Diapherotrites archaeon]